MEKFEKEIREVKKEKFLKWESFKNTGGGRLNTAPLQPLVKLRVCSGTIIMGVFKIHAVLTTYRHARPT